MEKLKLTSCLQVLEIRFRNISHVAVNKKNMTGVTGVTGMTGMKSEMVADIL